VQLSDVARLLGSTALRGTEAGPAAVTSAAPLLAAAPTSAAELVPALAQAVTRSGLFYEAHQEQWVAGEISVDELLAEPQGRLSPRLAEPAAGAEAAPEEPPRAAVAPVVAGGGDAASPEDASPGIDSRLAGIVRQQAETLADARFLWQGEVWPQQEMEWEIGRDDRGEEAQVQPAWYTRLRLELPRMGEVTALLRLDEAGLQVTLRAGGDDSMQALRTGRPLLEQALADAGLRLAGVVVDASDSSD
jgi:hypothetical protein